MTWPDDDFEQRIAQLEEYYAQYNLRSYRTIDYSESETGLTKLLFDRPYINFQQNQFTGRIDNIGLYLRRKVLGNQITDKEYERIIFSVWMMQGTINGDRGRIIRGVIRPQMHDSGMLIEPIPGALPEFHFYIDEFDGCLEGHSIGPSSPNDLVCLIRECHQKRLDDITPYFNVDFYTATGKFYEKCRFHIEK